MKYTFMSSIDLQAYFVTEFKGLRTTAIANVAPVACGALGLLGLVSEERRKLRSRIIFTVAATIVVFSSMIASTVAPFFLPSATVAIYVCCRQGLLEFNKQGKK